MRQAEVQFTVFGAGAVGGSLGAFLAKAGEDVVFVARNEDHVRAINTHGLRIQGTKSEFVVPARALTPKELEGGQKVVLLAVRSQDTEEAVRQLMPFLARDAMVVSLQNGLNEEIISQLVGKERTIGAYVNWPADYLGPGLIGNVGEGKLYIGELDGVISERVKWLEAKLSLAYPVVLTDNIWGYLWSKLIYGAIQYATVLVDRPMYETLELSWVQSILGDLVREAMQVPNALGIHLENFNKFDSSLFAEGKDTEMMDRIAAAIRRQPKTKTGAWRDIVVRRRRTDVDWIVGMIVRKGEALGVSLLMNRRLVELIHEIEEGKRPMGLENLEDLKAAGQ